jgi:hypothetical protein
MWRNKHEVASAKMKGKAKSEWKGATPSERRRPKGKSWKKVVGKDTGELGDMKVRDDDGASDIEVSDLSGEGEFNDELFDGYETGDGEKEGEAVKGGEALASVTRS